MSIFDSIVGNDTNKDNFKGYAGNPPKTESEYIGLDCWTNSAIAPTWIEIVRLQAEHDGKEYQRQRAAAYPSIADQLDTIYHSGIDAWKAVITAVKEEFPK
jgi:hypothetical protein